MTEASPFTDARLAYGVAGGAEPDFACERATGAPYGVALVARQPDGTERVVRSGLFERRATHARTLAVLRPEIATWPELARRDAAAGVTVAAAWWSPADATRAASVAAALGDARHAAGALVRRALGRERWQIGTVRASPEKFLSPAFRPDVRWFAAPPDVSLADPFLDVRDGAPSIVCERWPARGGTGEIVSCSLADGTISDVFAEPSHLSYPQPVAFGGARWWLPERHERGEIALFAERRDGAWARERVLLDVPGVDATMIERGGRWWLFYGDARRLPNTQLFLAWAPGPAGPWTPHPANPIVCDVRSARGGGLPFVIDGALVRPAQDCSRTYGGALAFNRIDRLDERGYAETTIARFEPSRLGGGFAATHHLSHGGGLCALDARLDRLDLRALVPMRGGSGRGAN